MPRKTETDVPTTIDPEMLYGLFDAARLVGRSPLRLADNVRRGHITPDAYRKPDVKQFPLFKGATLLAFLANPPALGRPTTLTETQRRALELAAEAEARNINPARHIAETLGIRVDSAHQLLDRARRRGVVPNRVRQQRTDGAIPTPEPRWQRTSRRKEDSE